MEKGVTNTEREKPRSNQFIKILQCRAERQGSENASYKVILSQRHLGYIITDKPEVVLRWPWLTLQGSSLWAAQLPPPLLWCSFPGSSPRLSLCRAPAWGLRGAGAMGALTPHLATSCLSRNPLASSQVFWDPSSCRCPGEQTRGSSG